MKLGYRNIVVMHVGFDYESKQIDEGRPGDVGESFGAQVVACGAKQRCHCTATYDVEAPTPRP